MHRQMVNTCNKDYLSKMYIESPHVPSLTIYSQQTFAVLGKLDYLTPEVIRNQ